nr:MAG TPA: hypothetical protein [Caudoviricetes sp.]
MAFGNNNYYGGNNYTTPFTPYANQSYMQPSYYNNMGMGMGNNNAYMQQQPIINNNNNSNQNQSNQQIYLPLTFVSDVNEAKRFIVNPNQTIYMRDSNSKDVMYIKSMDSQGTINFQTKKLVDVDMNSLNSNQQVQTQQNNIDLSNYVKRDELKALQDKINELNNALLSFNKPLNKEMNNNTTREKRG